MSRLSADMTKPAGWQAEDSEDKGVELPNIPLADDRKVREQVDKVLAARENQDKRISEMAPQDAFVREKVVVFHPDASGAIWYGKKLMAVGCPDTDNFSSPWDVLDRMRTDNVKTVLMWYSNEFDQSLKLLSELNQARDIERSALVILCPGEQAFKDLKARTKRVFLDGVLFVQKQQSGYRAGLQEIFKVYDRPDTFPAFLYKCRKPWRPETEQLEGEAYSKFLFSKLREKSGDKDRDYWVKAENVYHAIQTERFEDAVQGAQALLREVPDSIDAALLLGLARSKQENPLDVAKALMDQTLAHPDMNREKIFQLAKMFVTWKAADSLFALMTVWNNRKDLPSDHQYKFILSRYFALKGDFGGEKKYLLSAISDYPTRGEYLIELARFYERDKSIDWAVHAWQLALRCRKVNQLRCRLNLARDLALVGKTSEKERVLKAVLEKYPEHPEALKLK